MMVVVVMLLVAMTAAMAMADNQGFDAAAVGCGASQVAAPQQQQGLLGIVGNQQQAPIADTVVCGAAG